MKVITYSVSEWDEELQRYVTVEEESYDYEGPLSLAGGGGKTVQSTEPPSYAVGPMRNDIIPAAKDLWQTGLPDYYPGQTYAPMTNLERAGLNMQAGTARNLSETSGNLTGALNFGLSPDVLYGNPYLGAATDSAIRPVTQNFTENVLPTLRRYAVGGNNFDSTRRGIAEGIASRSYLDTIGDISTNMAFKGYDRGLTHQSQSMALAPNSMQAAAYPGSLLQGVGQAYRAENQLGIDDAISRYDYSANAPYEALNRYLQTVQGTSSGYGTQFGRQSSNPFATALGAGALGYGLLGGGAAAASPAALASGVIASAPADMAALLALGPLGSSRDYKDNIVDADSQLMHEMINSIEIKEYDYKPEYGGLHMVGMIAEDTPDKFTLNDGKAISLGSLVGALIASNQVLTKKVEELEGKLNGI